MFYYHLFLLRRCRFHTIWLITLTAIVFLSLFDYSILRNDIHTDSYTSKESDCVDAELFHKSVVDKYYQKRKNWTTSNLGTLMFKNVDTKLFSSKDQIFLVMVWKNWQKLVSKHVTKYDPMEKSFEEHVLSNCSVKNCRFSGKNEHFYKADAVIMTGDFVPRVSRRNLHQRWVFLSEDSPMRGSFLKRPYRQIRDLANVFNWTMTYRSDSDIPIPYGRTLPLPHSNDLYMEDAEDVLSCIVPYWAHKLAVGLHRKTLLSIFWIMSPYYSMPATTRRCNKRQSDSDIPIPYGRTLPLPHSNDVYMEDAEDALSHIVPYWAHKQSAVLVNILISNCNVKTRMDYIEKLRKYIRVDVFGNCSDGFISTCRDRTKDCQLTRDYLFYLVLEPASCRQFITEKVFQHAYSKGAIPIIMGPPIEDCEKLLPPNSFLHVSLDKTPADLALHVTSVAKDNDALLDFHAWRLHFGIENEHGYFRTPSPLFCRICEALNYNDGGVKSYSADDLELYFGRKITCDVTYV